MRREGMPAARLMTTVTCVMTFVLGGCGESAGSGAPTPPAPASSTTPSQSATVAASDTGLSTNALAWMLGNKLSLAVLLTESGRDPALADDYLSQARMAANELGLGTVTLPLPTGDQATKDAAYLGYLLREQGGRFADQLRAERGTNAAAYYEFAVKTNLLILLYGPGDSTALALTRRLQEISVDLHLPSGMTDNLMAAVQDRKPADVVKDGVFDLNNRMVQHLDT